MSSYILNLILMICLFRSLESLTGDFKNKLSAVCRLESAVDYYKTVLESIGKREIVDDCHHSVGVHLSKELCRSQAKVNTENSVTLYPSDNSIVLYVNIEPVDNNSRTSGRSSGSFEMDFSALRNMPVHNSLFVVVLKDIEVASDHHYEIKYKGRSKDRELKTPIHDKDLLEYEHQLLDGMLIDMGNRNYLSISLIEESSKTNQLQFSVGGYLIMCFHSSEDSTTANTKNCKPFEEDERVSCQCDVKDQLHTLFFFLILWIVTIGVIVKPMIAMMLSRNRPDKTDVALNVNCNPKNARFVYMIFLRLAKGTVDFDVHDVFVDMQFFADSNEPIGNVVRFSVSSLEHEFIGQTRIFVFRLTKMPDLTRARCSHNGAVDGRIAIFGAFVFATRGQDDYHKVYRANKDILREVREIPFVVADENQQLEDPAHLRILDNFPIHLSFLEIVWVLFVTISLISLHGLIPVLSDSIFLDMFIKVLIASLGAILFNLVSITVYKTLLRAELKQQILMNSSSENLYFVIIKLYMIALIVFSVIIAFFLSLSMTDRKWIETYRWICVIFCSTAIFCVVWNVWTHISFAKSHEHTELSVEEPGSTGSMLSVSEQGSVTI